MHVHIDPLGGLAGDMFVAAMANAFPEFHADAQDFIGGLGREWDASFHILEYSDGLFSGMRVESDGATFGHGGYRELDQYLAAVSASPEIKELARKFLSILAQAEATIHKVPVDEVHFHEIAGWDTLADVLMAAFYVVRSRASSWSVSPLPRGGGYVRTSHGLLPVPAPATMEILKGFPFTDDGIAGERVTPTGAAILQGLSPTTTAFSGNLTRIGHGFGTRKLPGVSNVTRISIYEMQDQGVDRDRVAVLTFDIDDQTPEEVAVAIDRLRALSAVIDVTSEPIYGKKGRIAFRVQVMTRPSNAEAVIGSCFEETTTLGIRISELDRYILRRHMETASVEGREVRVKVSRLPGGGTRVKSDIDDRKDAGPYSKRVLLRQMAESSVKDSKG